MSTEISSVGVEEFIDGVIDNEFIDDLVFANQKINCLQRMRNCLINSNSKCNCPQNEENKLLFDSLDNEYQELNREKDVKQLNTYCSRLSYLNQPLKTCSQVLVRLYYWGPHLILKFKTETSSGRGTAYIV
jgi:hypothetical protein